MFLFKVPLPYGKGSSNLALSRIRRSERVARQGGATITFCSAKPHEQRVDGKMKIPMELDIYCKPSRRTLKH